MQQIIAEVAGGDMQLEHATIKAGEIKHIEEQTRRGNRVLVIEVEAGEIVFTDMPDDLGECLAEAFGKWDEARNG